MALIRANGATVLTAAVWRGVLGGFDAREIPFFNTQGTGFFQGNFRSTGVVSFGYGGTLVPTGVPVAPNSLPPPFPFDFLGATGSLSRFVQTTDGSRALFQISDITLPAEIAFRTLIFDPELFAPLLFAGNDTFFGSIRDDVFVGYGGDDRINGSLGNDRLIGGAGGDWLFGGGGNDVLLGGRDDDHAYGGSGNDRIAGHTGDDFLRGDSGNDRIHGGRGDDELQGGSGRDLLVGGPGDDTLQGGSGNDLLIGGLGADRLEGGPDADVFRLTRVADSPSGGGDSIVDFEDGDRIDLRQIDADVTQPGNQAFVFIGSAPFSGTPGELRYLPASGLLAGSVDRDGQPELEIVLATGLALDPDSFIL
jgi:Ca2+-binding RTX toxin-like protein